MSKDLKNQSIIFHFLVKSNILKLSSLEKQPASHLELSRPGHCGPSEFWSKLIDYQDKNVAI